MGKAYSDEITDLPRSLEWASSLPIENLSRAVYDCAGKGAIVVGSGGSYTVAAYVAMLHELMTGHLSRAATPLDAIVSLGSIDASCVLLSAEGKNKDILTAAERARVLLGKGVALTLTIQNPLLEYCDLSGVATPIGFDMPWQKDGYLATNSLVCMMALFARAYLNDEFDFSLINAEWIASIRKKLASSRAIDAIANGANVIVLYGTAGRIGAVDFESKFSEAGLGFCQPVDFRQFAHGRHLQLSCATPPVVIALGNAVDAVLTDSSMSFFPAQVQTYRICLPDEIPLAELVGVVHVMLVIEAVALRRGIDVGQPMVPSFGRELYGMNIGAMLAPRPQELAPYLLRKTLTPFNGQENYLAWIDAAFEFVERLEKAEIRGLVCDFDGTCCYTPRRFSGLDLRLVEQIERITQGGVKLAFASGRGDSLQADLRQKLHKNTWANILVGYCSGSVISWLDEPFAELNHDERFVELASWLAKRFLIPSLSAIKMCGDQMSIRVRSNRPKERIVMAIANWIQDSGYSGWRVFCSEHSVDVLTESTGKLNVVETLSRLAEADSNSQVLRLGDSGQLGGNDYELLSEGLGLSVASVSPSMTACWNFLPEAEHGVAGMYRYLSSLVVENGSARFSPDFLNQIREKLALAKEAYET